MLMQSIFILILSLYFRDQSSVCCLWVSNHTIDKEILVFLSSDNSKRPPLRQPIVCPNESLPRWLINNYDKILL